MKWWKYALFGLAAAGVFMLLPQFEWKKETKTRTTTEEPIQNPSINILMLGCDASGVRPDSIMLVHLDADGQRVCMLSLPRDGKMRQDGRTRKLNTVLSLQDGSQAKEEISRLTGAQVDYYIKLQPGVLAEMVDALGGLEYTVEQDMRYSDPSQGLYIDLKAGHQLLDGDQCEQYCRYRSYAMGDLTRTRQQQKLLGELLRQKLQLRYLLKLPTLYNIMKENAKTDISPAVMAEYLPLARKMAEGAVEVEGLQCPGNYNDMEKEGVSYFIFDHQQLRALCSREF